jgi:hypothetical protein
MACKRILGQQYRLQGASREATWGRDVGWPFATAAWNQPIKDSRRIHDLMVSRHAEALKTGQISGTSAEVESWLVGRTHALVEALLQKDNFGEELAQVRFGGGEHVLAGIVGLLFARLWDVSLAYSDDSFRTAAGIDFDGLVVESATLFGFNARQALDSVNRSQHRYDSWDIREDRVGMYTYPLGDDVPEEQDRLRRLSNIVVGQTFDFFQTITEGRYTVHHWHNFGGNQLGQMGVELALAETIVVQRLGDLRTLREAIGLIGGVLLK